MELRRKLPPGTVPDGPPMSRAVSQHIRRAEQEQVAADVQAYLDAGGQITVYPPGYTEYDAHKPIGGRHIHLKGSDPNPTRRK